MPMRRQLGGTNVPRTDENTVTPAISISPAWRLEARDTAQQRALAASARPEQGLGVGVWTPEEVVHLKCICKAKVSYRYICERLERLTVITHREFDNVKFQKLEEALCGVP